MVAEEEFYRCARAWELYNEWCELAEEVGDLNARHLEMRYFNHVMECGECRTKRKPSPLTPLPKSGEGKEGKESEECDE